MARVSLLIAIVALALSSTGATGPLKCHISVKVDRDITFEALHTYMWIDGWTAFNSELDEEFVAAVDRELRASGLTRVDAAPVDVVVTYGAVRRTDVNVHGRFDPAVGGYPEYPAGTLVLLMMEPDNRRELFRARVSGPVDFGATQADGTIDTIVRRIFERYPTRWSER